MAVYGWYMLKASICIIVFYAFYSLVLRKCTFFLLNRLYLVAGIILSFIIPILKFPIFKSQSNSELSNFIYPLLIEPEYIFSQPQNVSDHAITINYSLILSIIYFTGISILFFKLLLSIIRIIRIKKHSEIHRIGQIKVIKMESYFPFSFFNMIFIPKNENNQMIINHEIAHTRQLHWLDLILIEIVSILLWFNPFVVLYKKSLKLQHEYLADASVINDNNIESYLICMLKQIQVVSFNGITSQFYCNTIKKRIIMITKNKTSNKYLGVYSLVLPLICFMLFAFSVNKGFAQNNTIAENEEVIENTLNQPSIYPVDSKKIKRTSAYYGKRENPVTKKAFFHHGMDFAIAEGENVVSTANGVVIEAEFDSKKGNYVIIQHNEVFSTLYSHLKSISVQVGDKLVQNQTIGYVGNTGRSTGSHLHYEVFKDGKNVNPEDYLPKQ
ncbi:hypothetical protein D0T85_21880 [Bacteroides sp. 519]|nr:hypothetical protein [Bacteroides sp. 519]